MLPDLQFSGAAYFLSNAFNALFNHFHHPNVVFISYINFHRSKFRIMSTIQPFIAKHLSKFIHTIKSAYN